MKAFDYPRYPEWLIRELAAYRWPADKKAEIVDLIRERGCLDAWDRRQQKEYFLKGGLAKINGFCMEHDSELAAELMTEAWQDISQYDAWQATYPGRKGIWKSLLFFPKLTHWCMMSWRRGWVEAILVWLVTSVLFLVWLVLAITVTVVTLVILWLAANAVKRTFEKDPDPQAVKEQQLRIDALERERMDRASHMLDPQFNG